MFQASLKRSLIVTVYNEELTIRKLLNSIARQSQLPEEIIIVDGGSTDSTSKIIQAYIKDSNLNIHLYIKKGNRSVGRNWAIQKSTHDIILITDAGCVLEKNWTKNISQKFRSRNVDVVAGYYKGLASTLFQKCLIPYVLVMPDRIDKKSFLPATRSMAMRKEVWKKLKGFPEEFSHNEDYVFAQRIKKLGLSIYFQKSAITYWTPRSNLKDSFRMFYRFALGDIESGLLRPKVALIFTRYLLFCYILLLVGIYRSIQSFFFLIVIIVLYIAWSVVKNYRYCSGFGALVVLPILQITSDIAVLTGSLSGLGKKILLFRKTKLDLPQFAKSNVSLIITLGFYLLLGIFLLRWGVPNAEHPFPYHMDEWHQLQSVRATIAYGSPNVEGAAHGTLFYFLTSALYLVPFTIIRYIDPINIEIYDFENRLRIFDLLRMNSLLYGSLSIGLVYIIARKMGVSKWLAVVVFAFNPLWLMLSGYFKYDIALIFWMLLSLLFFILYAKNKNILFYMFGAIPAGITVAVKVSGLPILAVYVALYLLFNQKKIKQIKYLFAGISLSIACAVIFGFPDTLFGNGNIYEYIVFNLFTGPEGTSNLLLSMNSKTYLIFKHYPVVLGYGVLGLFVFALIYWVISSAQNYRRLLTERGKIFILLLFSFSVFFLSVFLVGIYGGGNRSLVILPFMAFIIAFVYSNAMGNPKLKKWVAVLVSVLIFMQVLQVTGWVLIKVSPSVQEVSSFWIEKNIKKASVIGLENIPIYQLLPHILQKEFYFNQYEIDYKNKYTYVVIDAKTPKLPEYIVITNGDAEEKYLKTSPKKDLMNRIRNDGYIPIKSFSPNLKFYRYFGSDQDFYLSGFLVASPLTITVFRVDDSF